MPRVAWKMIGHCGDSVTGARALTLETLALEQDGRVLTARFSNPPHNFLTTRFIRDLHQLTHAVDWDPSVGAVCSPGASRGASRGPRRALSASQLFRTSRTLPG